MKKKKNIKDIDTLEKEIYRLKLEAKRTGDKFENNIDFLEKNYPSMVVNSFFSGEHEHEKKDIRSNHSFFRSERLNSILSSVTDHIAEKASDGIKDQIDKLFRKK